VRTLDLTGDQAASQIWGQEAQTGELTRSPLGAAECEITAEGDPSDPQGASECTCGRDDFLLQPHEHRAVDDLLEVEAGEHQIDFE
jgi:hypothetical protein